MLGQSFAGRITGDCLIALNVLLAIDLSLVMLRRARSVVRQKTYWKAYGCELVICTAFFLAALDLRLDLLPQLSWMSRSSVLIFRILLAFFCGFILLLGSRVIVGGLRREKAMPTYVIVLGMALENDGPCKDLLLRMDAAAAVSRECPNAQLFLSGGNPNQQGRTEAEAMRDLLLERGVLPERLLLEKQSEDTRANFRNASDMIDLHAPIAVITSDYHMKRAARAAAEAGFTSVIRIPAPSDPLCYAANVFWEIIAELDRMVHKS